MVARTQRQLGLAHITKHAGKLQAAPTTTGQRRLHQTRAAFTKRQPLRLRRRHSLSKFTHFTEQGTVHAPRRHCERVDSFGVVIVAELQSGCEIDCEDGVAAWRRQEDNSPS